MVGVRILIGCQSLEKAPSFVEIFGRVIQLSLTRNRWFDLPFTREESLSADKKFSLFSEYLLHFTFIIKYYQRKGHFKVFCSFKVFQTSCTHRHKLSAFICFQWMQLTCKIVPFCFGNSQSSNGQLWHLTFVMVYLRTYTGFSHVRSCFFFLGHFSIWPWLCKKAYPLRLNTIVPVILSAFMCITFLFFRFVFLNSGLKLTIVNLHFLLPFSWPVFRSIWSNHVGLCEGLLQNQGSLWLAGWPTGGNSFYSWSGACCYCGYRDGNCELCSSHDSCWQVRNYNKPF